VRPGPRTVEKFKPRKPSPEAARPGRSVGFAIIESTGLREPKIVSCPTVIGPAGDSERLLSQ